MPEQYYEAEVEVVEYSCDECCFGGNMKFQPYDKRNTTGFFIHKCDECWVEKAFTEKYPKVEFKKKESGEYVICH